MSPAKPERANILVGGALWLLCLGLARPHPLTFGWPLLLVLLGVLVLIPCGRLLFQQYFGLPGSVLAALLQIPAALALAISVQLEPGTIAASLAVPWLVVCGLMALHALKLWLAIGPDVAAARVALVGWLQIPIGAAWLFADRAAMQPMGFDGVIVRLTAAHFHFAGFLLPLMAGLLIARPGAGWIRFGAWGASGGVILVAAGITATKLGAPLAVESLFAAVFCLFVIVLSLGQILTACRLRNFWLLLSGLSLGLGMGFALLYALRLWLPLPWLHLPRMWAVHGSLQVFGFAACGLIGWWKEEPSRVNHRL